LICRNGNALKLSEISGNIRVTLESLKNAAFPFASLRAVPYGFGTLHGRLAALMIVCSCHVLSDHDVRDAVNSADILPRNPKQLYGCLGCSAECGRCARTIKGIIDEALGSCTKACQTGCPHNHVEDDSDFALAAS
jgi:bacterioferritin-associated ferredoxin